MVILITGASHTGKTLLAQRLVRKYGCSCLSMDLLKMGLIRSGNTHLTPEDDQELEACLWPIVREIIKTAVENRQDLIVEGCYVPARWRWDFPPAYLREIRFYCLVMTPAYVEAHFSDIQNTPAWSSGAWTTPPARRRPCWQTTPTTGKCVRPGGISAS